MLISNELLTVIAMGEETDQSDVVKEMFKCNGDTRKVYPYKGTCLQNSTSVKEYHVRFYSESSRIARITA
jgi:hypothetical protein